jgi:hypothetical protein
LSETNTKIEQLQKRTLTNKKEHWALKKRTLVGDQSEFSSLENEHWGWCYSTEILIIDFIGSRLLKMIALGNHKILTSSTNN